jgi:ATP-dependent RNA helicase RhlB
MVERLNRNNWKTQAIAGENEQKKRLQIPRRLQGRELAVLVATDVASRGIDVKGVTHVFNFDLPQDAEDYVHRIGRTGRAGETGKAISMADEEYVYSLEDIEKYIGQKIPVEWAEESLYLREIRRTQEEKQKHDQERLARTPAGPGSRRPGPGNRRPPRKTGSRSS